MDKKYVLNASKTGIMDINVSEFTDGTIIFPSKVDGYEIKSIAISADSLRNLNDAFGTFDVIVEDGILSMADEMFKYSNIHSISIPPSMQTIAPSCFYESRIKEVEFRGKSLLRLIGKYAFHKCKHLTHISLPKTVKIIAQEAFSESGLEEITILNEKSGISIGDLAFGNCYSLKKVTFSKTEVKLGYRTFYCCNSLISVIMNKIDIETIPTGCFLGCSSLEDAVLSKTVKTIEDCAFFGCKALASVGLSNTKVTHIGGQAFKGCKKYSDGYFPETIQNIGKQAFMQCNIDYLALPLFTLLEVGDQAFSENPLTKHISLLPFTNCDILGDCVFAGCKMKSVCLLPFYGDEVSGKFMFTACNNLVSVEIMGEAELYEGIFSHCDKLSNVKFTTDTITSIPSHAFWCCPSLKNINFPESIKDIGPSAFRVSGVESLDLSYNKSVKIHNHAFSETKSLKKVKLPLYGCTFCVNSFPTDIVKSIIDEHPFAEVEA